MAFAWHACAKRVCQELFIPPQVRYGLAIEHGRLNQEVGGGFDMRAYGLDRLLGSLNELEQSIHAAHRALANRIDARPELEERLRQYEAMLMAQRRAADELEDAMKQESWDAVYRRCCAMMPAKSLRS
jgi:hypothetical protein